MQKPTKTPLKIMTVFGTRPEAIKMAPVILELKKRMGIEVIKVTTSQHMEMLEHVLNLFAIVPDYDLKIMQKDQSLTDIVERAMSGFRDVFDSERPDVLLVQGDTTTAFIGALAGYYEGIPVGHIEAGLRTNNIRSPFPEEGNRRMISSIADHHFCPTQSNRENLIKHVKDKYEKGETFTQ